MPGSRPTPASPTSAGRRVCGRATRRPSGSPRSTPTATTRRSAGSPGGSARRTRCGRRARVRPRRPRHARALGAAARARHPEHRRAAPGRGLVAGDDDPPCPHCGGILKSATISFGENLDTDVIDAAQHAAVECDLLVAVGTSLGVHPAAGLVDVAGATGADVVIVNAEPTPYDDVATVVLRGRVGELLPRLVDGLPAP